MSFLRSTIVMNPSLVLACPGRRCGTSRRPPPAAVASGRFEVAGEDVVPADDDLAELAGRQQLDPVVDLGPGDLHLDAPDRVPDGAGAACRTRAGWWWRSARSRTGRTPRRSSAENAALNRSSTATGSERPAGDAQPQPRAAGRPSAPPRAAPMYMVGTPWKTVTFSRTISSIAASPVNRASSTSVPPRRNVPFMPTVCPNVWNSGRQPSTTSSGVTSLASKTLTVAFITRFRWVSSGALGLPGGAAGVEDDRDVLGLAGQRRCAAAAPRRPRPPAAAARRPARPATGRR